jgi:hypothetical protein
MEVTANALQTVAPNGNVIFTETAVKGNCSILVREGSGLVTLRGLATQQCRARFLITFGGNVAIPAGGTVGPITLGLAINGENVGAATMISTPTAAEAFNNVSSSVYIDVPTGCNYTISVKSLTTTDIDVQNANLIVERVA